MAELIESQMGNLICQREENRVVLDCYGVHYQELNARVRDLAKLGYKTIELKNVNGQRYIGTGIASKDLKIRVFGTAGNDLSAFMDGPMVEVFGNAQDAVSNTMNSGKVIIYGDAGDVIGYGMRGGKLFIKGRAGYRVGIHMKAYGNQVPVVVVGGTVRDFLGEYMAGGILVVLGLEKEPGEKLVGNWVGTGMHGGIIYVREEPERHQLGKEVGITDKIEPKEMETLGAIVQEYCADFSVNFEELITSSFFKLFPVSTRPYKKLYVY